MFLNVLQPENATDSIVASNVPSERLTLLIVGTLLKEDLLTSCYLESFKGQDFFITKSKVKSC